MTISTNNKDYFNNNDFHIFCLFSYFCDYLFSGWHSYMLVSTDVNQTSTNATTRDCWTFIIQNMFGDICNENSIHVSVKTEEMAIYSAVRNVIPIKKREFAYDSHQSQHSCQMSKRIFLSIKVF